MPKENEPRWVHFHWNRDDLNAIAIKCLFVILEEEDYPDGEEPTNEQLAARLSKQWIMTELKAELRANGTNYAQLLYDRISASKHHYRYKALSKVADARVAALFPI